MEQRYGPKVIVDIRYECNGCKFLEVVDFEDEQEPGRKCHACMHVDVLNKYKTPQYTGGRASVGMTIHHTAPTPSWCPYRK